MKTNAERWETFMKERRIRKLKKLAKLEYRAWENAIGEMSCGIALGEYISGSARNAKLSFNKIMDELTTLDSTTPKFRL